MIEMLMDTSATIVHYTTGAEDELGRSQRVETGREVVPARLEQRVTNEEATQAFTTDRWFAAFPEGTKLEAGDEVIADGRVYTVDGAPNVLSIPGFPVLNRTQAELIYRGPVTA
jgi:hypothetical protein